ncbi:MAG: electron transport complex subunit RsxE [Lachnospiraceae bacterium]|nr:electron transport complex subunit RsxE [Lachnospiraceae bacterium]
MKENSAVERLYNGLLKENPTFVLMLGMCPTLAVTTSAINGLGMGLTTAVVLALSNMIISLLRKIIPDKVRIPAFIVIIASFVTIVQLLLEAYLPSLNEALGVYIPLIVVNCIILGRAEAYAYFHGPISSLFDGIGMGLGFSMALTCIGAVRELLGTGKIFDMQVMPDSFTPIGIFVLAPGAFFVLAVLTAIQNFIKIRGEKRGKDMSKIGSGCGGDCMNCGEGACADRKEEEVKEEPVKAEEESANKESEEVSDKEEKEIKAEAADKAAQEADTAEELQAEEIQAEEKELSAEKPEESEKSEVKADEESEKAEEPVKEESSKKADKPTKEKKKSKADKKNKKKPVIEESTEIIDLDEEDE